MRVIKINGFLYGLSSEGRLRKNWKNFFYKSLPKISNENKCEKCGTKEHLTRHHNPPLRNSINQNTIILCEKCHRENNMLEKGQTLSPFSIKCEKCKGYRFFMPINKIQCKKCYNTIHLKEIREDEYEVVK